jgi:cation diffusion facilitator family transporter
MVAEGMAGILTNSLALMGDATHAAYDVLVTFLLLLSSRIALKPPDQDHLYGHGKFEPLGTLVAALLMLGLSFMIAVNAVHRIVLAETMVKGSELGFAVIGYAITIHLVRVGVLGTVLARAGGMTVKADLIHASSDLFSTVIAALGFYFAALGMPKADPLAGLTLAAIIGFMSFRLSKQAVLDLSDVAPKGLKEPVVELVESIDGVVKCESLRIRKSGDDFFVEMEISLPKHLSLEGAHDVVSEVERKVKERLGNAHVTIHFEPSEQ